MGAAISSTKQPANQVRGQRRRRPVGGSMAQAAAKRRNRWGADERGGAVKGGVEEQRPRPANHHQVKNLPVHFTTARG